MKKYVKPVFYAESYMFSDSIASCGEHITNNYKLDIIKGESYCVKDADSTGIGNADNGNSHKAGNSPQAIVQNYPVTLFNDGIGVSPGGCDYDWGGPEDNVVYDNAGNKLGTFAATFYGNESTARNHAPGYKGRTFFS